MKNILILFLFLTNLTFAQATKKESSSQLNDNPKNLTHPNEIVFSGDQLKTSSFRYVTQFPESTGTKNGLDSPGKIKIFSSKPVYFYTAPDSNHKYFFLFVQILPGEDITVSTDKTNVVQLSSPNKTRSVELSFFRNNLLFSNFFEMYYAKRNRNIELLMEAFDSVKMAKLVFLKNFVSKNKVSDRFSHTISRQIEDQYYYSLIQMLNLKKDQNLQESKPILEKIKKYYYADDSIYSYQRIQGINLLCSYITTMELKLKDTPENLYTTALKHFKGESLNYLLFGIVKNSLNIRTQETAKLIKEFYANCTDPDFINYIKSAQEKLVLAIDNSKSKNYVENLQNLNNTVTTWAQLAEKFKGKLIYVDFWGSFCGACIDEFPSLDKLKKRYAGKDIVFVRISIDKNLSDWRNSIKRLKIDDPNSYMLSDFKNSKMAERLQLTGVPRYILFDKKGNVVLLNAPRPGEENVGDIIEEFL